MTDITETGKYDHEGHYTWALSSTELAATREKIAKVNARAEKRGFTGRLQVVVTETRKVEETDQFTGFTRTYTVHDTYIDGEAPSYGGWKFLARVDQVGESFTLATAPGVEHVDRSLVNAGHCDHCDTNRFRKNTYVLQNAETGEIKTVGSTCIKDFLGHSANVVLLWSDDIERDVDSFIGGFGGYRDYSVETVLTYAFAATRAFGFVRSGAFEGRPTAEWVRLGLGLYKPTKKDEADLQALQAFAAEAAEKAAEIRTWILSEEFSGQSTYVENLKVVAAAKAVESTQIGLLASAPQAYTRHLETAVERAAKVAQWAAAKAAKQASDFIAPVGTKKVRVEGTISAIRYIPGDYNTTVLYTILTKDGNLVKWFASREALGENEGREVVIEGTVKKHEDYEGVKSTVLTRCKEVA